MCDEKTMIRLNEIRCPYTVEQLECVVEAVLNDKSYPESYSFVDKE